MTNEKPKEKLYKILGYDPHKLELYEIANEFFSQEKKGLAARTLEILLEDPDICPDPLARGELMKPGVIEKLVKSGLSTYQEFYLDQTIRDIIKYNESALKSYAGEKAEKIKKELEPFYGKKLDDIMKEMKKAEHIIEGKELGLNSETEAKSAEEKYNKYAKIFNAINLLEEKRKSGLRRKIEDAYYKDSFNELFASKEKNAEGEMEMRKAA